MRSSSIVIIPVPLRRSALADLFGIYPSFSAASNTALRFSSLTLEGLLYTRETVALLTPAAAATWSLDTGFMIDYCTRVHFLVKDSNMNFNEDPHRRLNILTGEWVKISPHRTKRPWSGQVEKLTSNKLPEYDPGCYLCPGNTRSGGIENPVYEGTFVFDNDFMAILPDTAADVYRDGLLQAETEQGLCRVICFSPRHDLTLALMEQDAVEKVVQVWIDQYLELGALDYINHVQIFENRGDVMGCSNPHPHGQVWAERGIPNESALELEKQKQHHG